MQHRAFVVMPFGQRTPVGLGGQEADPAGAFRASSSVRCRSRWRDLACHLDHGAAETEPLE